MADVTKIKRGTSSQWTSANTLLADGQFGLETDSGRLKIGDGVSTWNSLNYFNGGGTGFAYYEDDQYDSGTKFTALSGVTTTIPNNAAFTDESQLPLGNGSFFDSSTGKITPNKAGDSYIVRFNFKASIAVTNGYADLSVNIGGAIGDVFLRTYTFAKGAGITHSFSTTNLLFVGNTFIANGGLVRMTPSTDMQMWDINYTIAKIHSGFEP